MNVKLIVTNDSATVSFNHDALPKEFEPILRELEKAGKSIIFVDLSQIEYVRSEILAELIAIKRIADKAKAVTKLLNVASSVMHVFEISNLTSFFIFEQDYSKYSMSELLDLFHDPEQAALVSDFIASHYNGDYRNALIEVLASNDSILQECAILTIGRASDDESKDIIKRQLDSEYPNVVYAAVLVLGWLGDMSSKERIYSFLTHSSSDVAEAAGASIALLSDDDEPEHLKKFAASENPDIRKVVAGSLALINGNAAYDILKSMLLNEKNDDVRTVIARKISFFNKDEAVGLLLDCLNDSSCKVQEAAAAGLERTGLKGREKDLIGKIGAGNDWVSFFAVRALGKNCSSETAAFLQKIYPKEDGKVKLAILESLAGGSIPFLSAQLADENEDIRKTALNSIHAGDKSKGVEEAEKLLAKDISWLVRYKAVEIIAAERKDGYRVILAGALKQESNKYIQDKIATVLAS